MDGLDGWMGWTGRWVAGCVSIIEDRIFVEEDNRIPLGPQRRRERFNLIGEH